MTPETRARVDVLRQKVADKTITMEEMMEAIKLLRGSRMSAASRPPSTSKKKGDTVTSVNFDDL